MVSHKTSDAKSLPQMQKLGVEEGKEGDSQMTTPIGYPYHLLTGGPCNCEEGCLPLEKRPDGWREWQRSEWWIGEQMVSPGLPEPASTREVIEANEERRRGAPRLMVALEGPGVDRDREFIEEFQTEGLFVLLGAG